MMCKVKQTEPETTQNNIILSQLATVFQTTFHSTIDYRFMHNLTYKISAFNFLSNADLFVAMLHDILAKSKSSVKSGNLVYTYVFLYVCQMLCTGTFCVVKLQIFPLFFQFTVIIPINAVVLDKFLVLQVRRFFGCGV